VEIQARHAERAGGPRVPDRDGDFPLELGLQWAGSSLGRTNKEGALHEF
jgi:hypothetical protein